jgi:hypothetical protein
MNAREILDLFGTFISSYSADEKDAISQFAESTISGLLDAPHSDYQVAARTKLKGVA